MNLSLVFLVLSAFIGFLLYDMFKKSRQQQELANVQQNSTQKLGASQSRLKPNYQAQCSILRQLHQQKLVSIKHKNISIHLKEQNEVENYSSDKQIQVISIIKALVQTHNVYLLVCRKKVLRNQLIEAIKMGGGLEIGYDGTQGAVAVLRQLNCGTHLQGELTLYNIIVQYLPMIWLSHPQKQDSTYQFKTELDMILNLQLSLKKGKEMKSD